VQEFVETARRLGLSGYVPKQNSPLLQEAVEAMLHDQTFFPTNLESSGCA
jgi:DNA-binding NarL/FixJ family response regulator